MNRKASVLLLFGLLAAGVIWLLQRGEKEPATASYHFFYYPKLNVYFDPSQEEYIYPVEEGTKRTWTRIKGPAEHQPSALGGKVDVVAPSPEVWQHNEAHRQQYSSVVHAAASEPVYLPDESLAGHEKAVSTVSHKRKTAAKKGTDEKGKKKKEEEKKDASKVEEWLKKGIKKIFKKEA